MFFKERNLNKVLLTSLFAGLIVLSQRGASAHGASFDDDVRTAFAPNSRDSGAAWGRLQKGGPDAVTAIVKGLDGLDRDSKLRLLRGLHEVMSRHRAPKERDSDAAELARQARRQESDASLRGQMILTLGTFHSPTAIRELERFATEDPVDRLREIATESICATDLVRKKDQTEAAFFRKQTKDKNRAVQVQGYVGLTRLGDKSGRDFALQTLKESADFNQRGLALWILGEIANPEDTALLKQIAESPAENYSSKSYAITAQEAMKLHQLSAKEQLGYLIKALDNPNGDIRGWAYGFLSDWPDPMTTTRLKIYMGEPGHKGYKEAADALSFR